MLLELCPSFSVAMVWGIPDGPPGTSEPSLEDLAHIVGAGPELLKNLSERALKSVGALALVASDAKVFRDIV